ncbi:LysE family transporter [Alteribacter keqinensis]|uniref:Amino acid transporter n=1 Tax=Alteribacter keqinensis TaxID=2483800 RepID=A0A3M7TLC6_9BACI|nr:LysE family transporter [Alteribacter keqinensis]RNA66134.1 amino acid transporter [Alteribacter keqinensis]
MSESWFYFILLGISLAAPIGPVSLEMLKKGLFLGFCGAIAVGLGGLSADFVFMSVIYAGAATLFTHPLLQGGMMITGAAMLLFLGFQSFSKPVSSSLAERSETDVTCLKSYFIGFGIAILNPLNLMFWFGIYGSTLTNLSQNHTTAVVLIDSFYILLGVLLWNLLIASLVHGLRTSINDRTIYLINIAAGVLLLFFGVTFCYQAVDFLYLNSGWFG